MKKRHIIAAKFLSFALINGGIGYNVGKQDVENGKIVAPHALTIDQEFEKHRLIIINSFKTEFENSPEAQNMTPEEIQNVKNNAENYLQNTLLNKKEDIQNQLNKSQERAEKIHIGQKTIAYSVILTKITFLIKIAILSAIEHVKQNRKKSQSKNTNSKGVKQRKKLKLQQKTPQHLSKIMENARLHEQTITLTLK